MLLPSIVHVSSTFKFGAMTHDCLSGDAQGNPPFSPFFRSPMNVIAYRCSCVLHLRVGDMFHDCLSADPQVQSSILPLFFFRSPINVIA